MNAETVTPYRPFLDLTLSAVNAEFIHAQVKHASNTPARPDMPNGERLAILVEEVGEAAKAMTYDGDPTSLVRELLQVACVALAWVEGVDA